jgi:hypothetical protein
MDQAAVVQVGKRTGKLKNELRGLLRRKHSIAGLTPSATCAEYRRWSGSQGWTTRERTLMAHALVYQWLIQFRLPLPYRPVP